MSQTKVPILSEFIGSGTLDPKKDVMAKERLPVANGVVETKEDVPLNIFVRNVYDQPRWLQMKTVLV